MRSEDLRTMTQAQMSSTLFQRIKENSQQPDDKANAAQIPSQSLHFHDDSHSQIVYTDRHAIKLQNLNFSEDLQTHGDYLQNNREGYNQHGHGGEFDGGYLRCIVHVTNNLTFTDLSRNIQGVELGLGWAECTLLGGRLRAEQSDVETDFEELTGTPGETTRDVSTRINNLETYKHTTGKMRDEIGASGSKNSDPNEWPKPVEDGGFPRWDVLAQKCLLVNLAQATPSPSAPDIRPYIKVGHYFVAFCIGEADFSNGAYDENGFPDPPPVPIMAVHESLNMFPVRVSQMGGSGGSCNSAASWTYGLKDFENNWLKFNVGLDKPRPNGRRSFASSDSFGLAFYDDMSNLRLWDTEERPEYDLLSSVITAWKVQPSDSILSPLGPSIQMKTTSALVVCSGPPGDWVIVDQGTECDI